jgi:hypothetical protein
VGQQEKRRKREVDEIISSSKEEMGKAIEKLRQDNELRIKSLTGAAFLAYSPSSHAEHNPPPLYHLFLRKGLGLRSKTKASDMSCTPTLPST